MKERWGQLRKAEFAASGAHPDTAPESTQP